MKDDPIVDYWWLWLPIVFFIISQYLKFYTIQEFQSNVVFLVMYFFFAGVFHIWNMEGANESPKLISDKLNMPFIPGKVIDCGNWEIWYDGIHAPNLFLTWALKKRVIVVPKKYRKFIGENVYISALSKSIRKPTQLPRPVYSELVRNGLLKAEMWWAYFPLYEVRQNSDLAEVMEYYENLHDMVNTSKNYALGKRDEAEDLVRASGRINKIFKKKPGFLDSFLKPKDEEDEV